MYEEDDCQGRSAMFFEIPEFLSLDWAANLSWNGFPEDKEFRSMIIEPSSIIEFYYD